METAFAPMTLHEDLFMSAEHPQVIHMSKVHGSMPVYMPLCCLGNSVFFLQNQYIVKYTSPMIPTGGRPYT